MAFALIAGLASAAGHALAIGAFTFSWAAFAIGAGLSLVSRALMPKLDAGSQMGGRSVTTREAAHSRKIVYGRARIGGNIVYLESTGSDNKHLWLVIAVAGHEIDGYESVWFNDEKVWDGGVYQSGWASSGSTSTSPYVYIGFHNGDQTSVDGALDAASTKWTANHILLDTAYMVVKLTYDQDRFAQGLPNISTIVRGKKVLDPTSITAGSFVVGKKYQISAVGNTNFTAIGASANTVGVEFTATGVGSGTGTALLIDWSDNPALCAYDYLRDTKYGLGETVANILTASVTTAKGVCDQTVSLAAGGTQKRYTINGVVDTANSIKSNIEQMLGSMIGRLVYSSGQFEIHAGAYVAPSFTIDESVAVGEITVQTKQSRRNAYNGVKGMFLSDDDNYVMADYPAQVSKTVAGSFEVGKRYQILTLVNGGSSTDFTAIGASANTVGIDFTATGVGAGTGTASLFLAQDGHQIFLDMALPFTTNNIRAQRIAKLALLRSRQQEAITIPCNLSALRFKIGDNINVYNTRFGWTNPSKIFEVVGYSMAFSSDGQIVVNVDAIETAASIWDWSTTDEEVFLGGGEVELYDGTFAAAPTSINVTSDSFLSDDGTFNSQFKVSWTNAADAFTDHYIVEWKLASVSDYFSQTTKSTPFSIVNLVNNASYNVRVKAVNEIGVSSAYLSATETSAVDATAPNFPTSVSATGEFEQITIHWTNPTVDDFKHVNIYRGDSAGATPALIDTSSGTSFIDTGLVLVNGNPVQKFYKLKSVDNTGNLSTNGSDNGFSAQVNATTTLVPVGGIADDAVDTEQIADGAVETDQIGTDAVTNVKIGDDAVATAQIIDNAVTNALIATDAVNADSLAANSVAAVAIVAGTITATQIAGSTITAAQIAANTITATQIAASSITVDKLSGDVTELYPVSLFPSSSMGTSGTTTYQDFWIPTPDLDLSKRQKVTADFAFTLNNTTSTSYKIYFQYGLQLKSKSALGISIGTVTHVSNPLSNHQLVSISGNQLEKLDNQGSVAKTNNASGGSNAAATLRAVWFDHDDNKTYVLTANLGNTFSTNDTMFFSASKFASSGTFVAPNLIGQSAMYVPAGIELKVTLPLSNTFGASTTATNLRPFVIAYTNMNNVTGTFDYFKGTLENVS